MDSPHLENRYAVVTGAAGGIGHAIACHLAAHGATLLLVARSTAQINPIRQSPGAMATTHLLDCDLARNDDIRTLCDRVAQLVPRVDLLVHGAGVISLAPLESVSAEALDDHYRINVRAPVLLTQGLLPFIRASQGQIVFINSSVGVRSKDHVGAYAASKHALKAIADTLRMEVNASGVRVLSVFPGNTATPMQQRIQEIQGNRFDPDIMLQPNDVASMIVNAILLPRTAEVTDIHIRPMRRSP